MSSTPEFQSSISTTLKSTPTCNFEKYSHATWYVGNAKLVASYFVSRMGFNHIAYRGLETGSRNIAAHVVGNGSIRFVFLSGLRNVAKIEETSNANKGGSLDATKIGFSGYCTDEEFTKEMNDHLIVCFSLSIMGLVSNCLDAKSSFCIIFPFKNVGILILTVGLI